MTIKHLIITSKPTITEADPANGLFSTYMNIEAEGLAFKIDLEELESRSGYAYDAAMTILNEWDSGEVGYIELNVYFDELFLRLEILSADVVNADETDGYEIDFERTNAYYVQYISQGLLSWRSECFSDAFNIINNYMNRTSANRVEYKMERISPTDYMVELRSHDTQHTLELMIKESMDAVIDSHVSQQSLMRCTMEENKGERHAEEYGWLM